MFDNFRICLIANGRVAFTGLISEAVSMWNEYDCFKIFSSIYIYIYIRKLLVNCWTTMNIMLKMFHKNFSLGYYMPKKYNPADHFISTLAINEKSEEQCVRKVEVKLNYPLIY